VEAVEGTNETIKRGGTLCNRKAVVCKAARAKQDNRFDIPVIGFETLLVLKESGCSTLAVESHKIFLVDKVKTVRYADDNKIAIIGL